jgi:hypothetical protein
MPAEGLYASVTSTGRAPSSVNATDLALERGSSMSPRSWRPSVASQGNDFHARQPYASSCALMLRFRRRRHGRV